MKIKIEYLEDRMSKWKNTNRNYIEFLQENTYKCKCGHSVIIFPNEKYKLCNWCNNNVYKDKKEEFKDKLNYFLRKEGEINGLSI